MKRYDDRILDYIQSVGTVSIAMVSKNLGIKYDTVKDAIYRLSEDGKIYHINGTESPRMYSVWCSVKKTDKPDIQNPVEKGVLGITPELYGRISGGIRRATQPNEIIREKGFVCHPKVNPKVLGLDFIRSHYRGCYTVDIIKKGKVEETYALPEYNATGGWRTTVMRNTGNLMVYGHIKIRDEEWKFHALTNKTGEIGKLNIYVHSRYIYYQGERETARLEHEQQIRDICLILQAKGWIFGNEITPNGNLESAINSEELGNRMPRGYNEQSTDPLHYDNSHGIAECEVHAGIDHDETVEIMVNLPHHVKTLYSMIEKLTIATTNLSTVIISQYTEQPPIKTDSKHDYGGMFQ